MSKGLTDRFGSWHYETSLVPSLNSDTLNVGLLHPICVNKGMWEEISETPIYGLTYFAELLVSEFAYPISLMTRRFILG